MASTINADDGVVSGSAGVKTSADNSGVLELQSSGTTQFTLGSSSVVINEAGADVDFRVEGDTDPNLFVVDASTDRIGVGTNTPTQKLSVNSGAATTVAHFASTGSSAFLGLGNSGAITYIGNDSTSGNFIIQTPPGSFSTKLTLDPSGNLGIGTTSPAEKLEVEFNTNGYILADNSTDTNTGIKFANTGRTYGIFTDGGSGSSNSLRFYDFTASAERLRLDSVGNLGLGVTPSTWTSTAHIGRVLQTGGASYFGRTDNSDAYVGSNVYRDTSDWKRIATGSAALLQQSGNNHYLYGVASDSANVAISWTQLAQVGLGTSLALQGATSQAGTGITFPATQNASSNANTLDDYEEGTWTPTIEGSTTNPVYGASVAQGNYTKIGSMVYVEFLIVVTSVTSQGVGNIRIGGMPFSSSSGFYYSNISFVYNDIWNVNVRNGYTTGFAIQLVPNAVTQSNLVWSGATLSTGYFSGAGWYIA